MITLKDGTILRNLEEQVLENKEQIAKHWNVDRILADFGIKMLGRFDSYDDIKDIDEGENYGNAYLIGTEEPYDVYVWTRADVNAGQPVPYWLDIGPISLVGPQGPEGPQGEQGIQGLSTKWYASNLSPSNPENYELNDQYLNTTNGNVYELDAYVSGQKYWRYTGNIKGPQGVQGPQGIQGERGPQGEPGPQGERGDVGGFINIWGILTQSSQLPTPASLNNLTVAYLIGTTMPYDLWIQVGENSATAIWQNTGPFNAATAVSVGGIYQNVWDADTKLDKVTAETGYRQIYIKQKDGTQAMFNLADAIPYSSVPVGDNGGRIFTGDPTANYHATNKVYVDSHATAIYKHVITVQEVAVGPSDKLKSMIIFSTKPTAYTSLTYEDMFNVISCYCEINAGNTIGTAMNTIRGFHEYGLQLHGQSNSTIGSINYNLIVITNDTVTKM